jgi:branched-chain amino acid transport system permease protein
MPSRLWLAGFLVLLLVAPLLASEFHVTLLNYIGLYSLVALGLVLLTGVGGLTSFGQAAFVGLGAYTTAYLSTAGNLPSWAAAFGGSPWLGLLAGLLLTAVVALVLGLLTLRLSGHYLPLGTIAWGISLRQSGFSGWSHRHVGDPGFVSVRTGTQGRPQLLLRDLGRRAGCRLADA